MSTSTNFLLRSIFSAIISFAIFGPLSASTNSSLVIDSCTANIAVQYDSPGGYAILTVSHSGTLNSSIEWFDSSSTESITVTSSGEYCVTVFTETLCSVTKCINVDIGAGSNCQSYIIKEPLSEGGYMLIAETNDPHPNTSYQWTTGELTNSVIVNHSGEYCVDVTSSYGCPSQACIYVDVPVQNDSCSVTVFSYPDTIYGGAYVSVDPTGISPFTYLWSNGALTNSIDVQTTGDYCVTVTDADGCVGIGCKFIEVGQENHIVEFTVPGNIDLSLDVQCFADVSPLITGDVNDEFTTCGSGYEATYSDQIANTCGESYEISRTWSLADDCGNVEVKTQIISVTDVSAPTFTVPVDITLFMDPTSCSADTTIANTGIPTTVTDDCSNDAYTYYVDHTTINDDNSNCGYNITLTRTWFAVDRCGNKTSDDQIITVIDTTQNNTPDSCFFDVVIFELARTSDVVALGVDPAGVAPFTYLWSDGSTGEVLDAQVEGQYCVTIFDAKGCQGSACYYAEFEHVTTDTCHTWLELLPQDNSTIKVLAHSEGSGDLSYSWSNAPAGTAGEPYFYAEASGEYCVAVYDANQCLSNACIQVEIDSTTSDSCYFDIVLFEYERNIDFAKLGADPTGVAPFIYTWSDGSSSEYFYAQAEGNFCVTITDANGCEGHSCYYVEFEPATTDTCSTWLELIPQDDGTVKVWAHSEGSGYLSYGWSNNPAGTMGEPYFYAEASGEYCVTVYDANQCVSEACIQVEISTTEPTDSCYSFIEKKQEGDNRYKLSVETEGVGPFTIVWHDSQFQDGDFLYIEHSGNYCATIYDANQCVSNACIDIIIDLPTTDSCRLEIVSTVFADDFVAEVKAESYGTSPFEYMWSDGTSGNAIEVYESKDVCVTVTDATGCLSTKCIELEVPERPCSLQIIRDQNSTDSLIVLEAIADGEGEITYLWDNGEYDKIRYITESGQYCLTITSANGCIKTECIFIDIDNIVCETEISYNRNSTDYEVILDANPAGVGPFTFEWTNGSTSSTVVITESGTYCVIVKDARGCISEKCQEVFIAIPVCESKIETVLDSDDQVTIKVETEGIAPFEYYWSTGENGKAIKVTVSKEYCVEVIDALGCISWDCKYIEVVDYSSCSVEIEVISNTDSTAHKVIANPSGTAPFTYQWAHGDTTRYFYPELDGYFCVTVTDAEGCVSETCYKTEGITPSVELEAYPNPARGNFFVEIDSELEFRAIVEIRDIKGNLLFTTTIDVEEGIQGLNFNSDQYPSGVFFVNIIRGSHVESIRVIKAGN